MLAYCFALTLRLGSGNIGMLMGEEFLIAALVYVIACLGLVLYLQKQSSKLKTKVDALTVLVKESDRQREAFKRELHELRSGTIGVGRRVVELEKKLDEYATEGSHSKFRVLLTSDPLHWHAIDMTDHLMTFDLMRCMY